MSRRRAATARASSKVASEAWLRMAMSRTQQSGSLRPLAARSSARRKRFVDVGRRGADARRTQVITHRRPAADLDAADQDLGEGQRVGEHRTRRGVKQDAGRRSVMDIAWAQMSDEDTGVQRDHAGQSARSLVSDVVGPKRVGVLAAAGCHGGSVNVGLALLVVFERNAAHVDKPQQELSSAAHPATASRPDRAHGRRLESRSPDGEDAR